MNTTIGNNTTVDCGRVVGLLFHTIWYYHIIYYYYYCTIQVLVDGIKTSTIATRNPQFFWMKMYYAPGATRQQQWVYFKVVE